MTENITKISTETCVPLCRFAAVFRSYGNLLSNMFPIIISPMDFEQTSFFFKSGLHFLLIWADFVLSKLSNWIFSPHLALSATYTLLSASSEEHTAFCASFPSGVTAADSLVHLQRPVGHPVPELKFCFLLAKSPGKTISVNHSWLYPMAFQPWHTSNRAYLIKFLPCASSSPFCAFYISLLLPYVLLYQLLCLSVSFSKYILDGCNAKNHHFVQDLQNLQPGFCGDEHHAEHLTGSGSIWLENKEYKCLRQSKWWTPVPVISTVDLEEWATEKITRALLLSSYAI